MKKLTIEIDTTWNIAGISIDGSWDSDQRAELKRVLTHGGFSPRLPASTYYTSQEWEGLADHLRPVLDAILASPHPRHHIHNLSATVIELSTDDDDCGIANLDDYLDLV